MPVIVSLLRGVNVAGRQIRMEALRALYQSIGLEDPQTYIQSGNVVFRIRSRISATLPRKIEAAIKKEFGFHSDVLLRTREELDALIPRNPFAKRRGIDPARIAVFFLGSEPTGETRARVAEIRRGREEPIFTGRELFIHFPDGMGKSQLPVPVLERILATPTTARNWNTVLKLATIAAELDSV